MATRSRPSRRWLRAWRYILFGGLILALADSGPLLAQLESGTQHDTSLPIEITADSLEVEQERQVATFIGTVDAQQGDLRLRADTVRVYYQDKTTGGGRTISRIEASGDVFVSSLGETAKGDDGVYDVVARTIELTGQVTLTRGQNVIHGDRLELDLDSGVSRVLGGASGGRVKGLFVPEEGEAAQTTGEE